MEYVIIKSAVHRRDPGSAGGAGASRALDSTREETLKDPLRHLPFGLVALIVLYIGFIGLAVHIEWRALVTLLAPVLWLGLYVLVGTDRATKPE